MRINNLSSQKTNTNRNFTGLKESAGKFIAQHPGMIAGMAGASVVAQKIVMSGSEAVIGPVMDIGIGKGITKITNEKDNRTNEASKVQAVRTFAQAVGGTIVGVIIRTACIAGSVFALSKACEKGAGLIAKTINPDNLEKNSYKFQQTAEDWGKNIGGAVAIGVMMFTNFLVDAPFINWINKKSTEVVDKFSKKDSNNSETQNAKEAK